MLLLRILAFALATVSQMSSSEAQGADKDKQVKVTKQWRSEVKQGKPNWNVIPDSGIITNSKDWARLWKAWFGDEKLPAVDFDKEIILVAGTQGWTNAITICDATIDKMDSKKINALKVTDGDLRFSVMAEEKGGPGYTYLLLKIDRQGIKSVGGQSLPK